MTHLGVMRAFYLLTNTEDTAMWNQPTDEQLKRSIPSRLYDTEFIALPDKIIYAHFFIGSCDWWITEFDGNDLFFGFAILNGDVQNAEWGYISFNELKEIKVGNWLEVDNDVYWTPKPASEVEKIRRVHNWPMPNLASKRIDNITA
jgi:hypothetical protein